MKHPSPVSSTRLLLVAFLFLLIVISAMAVPANAAPRGIVTVTNTNDSGAGSLRGAIVNALPNDTIVFSLTLPATITLASALEITQSLTISGPGSSLLSLSGDYATRVMTVSSVSTLNLSDITITQGSINWQGSAIYNAGTLSITGSTFAVNSGGPIWNKGTLHISDSTFSGNHSIFSSSAIDNDNVMTVANSIFSNNTAYGPAIGNTGILTITNTTLSGNNGRDAGGIVNDGTLIVSDTSFSGNNGWSGGGISNRSDGTLTVAKSTFAGNSAYQSGQGGGIDNFGIAIIANSTFYSNTATSQGGGIYNSATLTMTNATFSGNSAVQGGGIYVTGTVTATLRNTIVANSTAGGNCSGAITNGGNNLDDGTTCGWGSFSGSMSNTNPNLGSLANNGGATQTMALLPGSPAIDGVAFNAPNGCPSSDQRGVARPIGLRCDIGAYEARYFLFPLVFR